MLVQVELGRGNTRMVCFLPRKLKVGTVVTLKKEAGTWEVLKEFGVVDTEPNRSFGTMM
jgi:hypothetical protein